MLGDPNLSDIDKRNVANELIAGFLKDRKYEGKMPEVIIGSKTEAVDSRYDGNERIFITKEDLNSSDVLSKLGHELGHFNIYDKDEKTAGNIEKKIDVVINTAETNGEYNSQLEKLKDKYKDLPNGEKAIELQNKIPDEYKETLLPEYIFSPIKTAEDGIANKEDIKEINGDYYYQGKKIGFYQELNDGKIAYIIESKDYVVEEIQSTLVGIALGTALKAGGKVIINTPAGKYVATKAGKIIGRLKPGTKEFEFINEAVSPNSSGTVNKTKIKNAGQEIIVNSLENKKLVQKIIKEGDRSGELTEELVNKLAKEKKYVLIEGGKYGSNNGIDHILVSKDGSSLIILDSKQMSKSGTFSISLEGAGKNAQLSDNWIKAVAGRLKNKELGKKLIENVDRGVIETGVIGVDKASGKVILVPIKVD